MNDHQLKLVVFDWAGTIVDYGSTAPEEVFRKCFVNRGIYLTREEIRKPMGMEKKDHIRELLRTETGTNQWKEQFGRDWTEEDVDDIYETFEEELRHIVAEHSRLIPGAYQAVQDIREKGILIGSTTGYTPEMMEIVTKEAEKDGFVPDYLVTPKHVGSGRPAPFMIYETMRQAGVYPASRVVKVGDTAADIWEARNAGVWSVGVIEGSSAAGMSREERESLSPEEISQRKKEARRIYEKAGADYIIDEISELPQIIDEINRELGEE